jgi:hypothetical protein
MTCSILSKNFFHDFLIGKIGVTLYSSLYYISSELILPVVVLMYVPLTLQVVTVALLNPWDVAKDSIWTFSTQDEPLNIITWNNSFVIRRIWKCFKQNFRVFMGETWGTRLITCIWDIYIYTLGAVYTTIFPKNQNRYYCINIRLLAVDVTCFDPYVGSSSGVHIPYILYMTHNRMRDTKVSFTLKNRI